MYQGIYEIISNKKLTESIFEMVLEGDTTSISAPGQFINIKLDSFYLRRLSSSDLHDISLDNHPLPWLLNHFMPPSLSLFGFCESFRFSD